jgi:hypothetical protein
MPLYSLLNPFNSYSLIIIGIKFLVSNYIIFILLEKFLFKFSLLNNYNTNKKIKKKKRRKMGRRCPEKIRIRETT